MCLGVERLRAEVSMVDLRRSYTCRRWSVRRYSSPSLRVGKAPRLGIVPCKSTRDGKKKCSPSASETKPVRSDARLGVQSLRGLRFASLQRSNVYRLHQPVASGNPPSKRDLVLAINTPYACLRTLTFYH